jgi:hypothetical protein
MSGTERYQIAMERCQRKARAAPGPTARGIWTKLKDTYELLLDTERLSLSAPMKTDPDLTHCHVQNRSMSQCCEMPAAAQHLEQAEIAPSPRGIALTLAEPE